MDKIAIHCPTEGSQWYLSGSYEGRVVTVKEIDKKFLGEDSPCIRFHIEGCRAHDIRRWCLSSFVRDMKPVIPKHSVPLRVGDKVRVVDIKHSYGNVSASNVAIKVGDEGKITKDFNNGYGNYYFQGYSCSDVLNPNDLQLIPTEADITVGSVWFDGQSEWVMIDEEPKTNKKEKKMKRAEKVIREGQLVVDRDCQNNGRVEAIYPKQGKVTYTDLSDESIHTVDIDRLYIPLVMPKPKPTKKAKKKVRK